MANVPFVWVVRKPVLTLDVLFLLFSPGFIDKIFWIFFVRSEFSFVDLDDDSSQICLEILYDLVKKVTHSVVVNLQVFRGISIDKAIDGVTSLLSQF